MLVETMPAKPVSQRERDHLEASFEERLFEEEIFWEKLMRSEADNPLFITVQKIKEGS